MTEPFALDQSGWYRIVIQGHVPSGWADWFGRLALGVGYDAAERPVTTLYGVVNDQAELHGILMRIRDLGLSLLLVEWVSPTTLADANGTANDPG